MEVSQSLRIVLDTTDQAVRSWLSGHKSAVKVWANAPEIRQSAKELFMISGNKQALITSTTQAKLRSWFQPLQKATDYQGYFIIGPGNFNLASSRDQNIGVVNLLLKQEKFLQKVWSGKTAISFPEKSDVPLPDKHKQMQEGLPTMFVGAPIFNKLGQVLAIFTFRLDPTEDFTDILQQGRVGQTGETYAFDDSGRLISNSRFDEQLRETGLIAPDEHAILNVELRDPIVNLAEGLTSNVPREQQPLTRMAELAIAGKSGIDMGGYRNYLGVPVVGAWLWNSELGFGIASEISIDETYQSARSTKQTIVSLTIIVILLLIGMTVIYCIYFQRNIQSRAALRESNQYNRMLFNESTIGLALCRMNGALVDINPAYSSIIGRPVEETLKLSYWDITPEKYAAEEQVQLANLEKTGRYGPYEKEYIHADGHLVPVRLQGQTLEKDGEKFLWSSVEDITKRKKAGEVLRESEMTLSIIFEQAAVGVALIESHNGKFLRINKKYCDIVGYSYEEMQSLDFMQITHPDDLQEDLNKMQLLLDGKIHEFSMEKRLFRKDRSIVWVSLSVSPMWKTGEHADSHIAVVEDITKRKQAEKILRRSEVLEQLAIGASLSEILTALVIDAEKFSSDSLCSVLLMNEDGKHLHHGATQSLPDFYNKGIDGMEIGPEIGSCGVAAYTGKRVIVEDIMNHPYWTNFRELAEKADLRACWSEPILSSTGAVLGTYAIYYRKPCSPQQRDLEFIYDSARLASIAIEHKQAEEALQKSEMTLSAIFEQAAVGVALIKSHSGKFLKINKKYSDIIGYSFEEILFLDFMKITHPDDLQEDLDNMQLLMDGKIHEFSMEKRLFKKDGSILWINLAVSPMWKTGEPPSNHIAVVEDITERKQAENALKNLVESTSVHIGQDFFRILVNRLADALGVQYAFIGELFGEQKGVIQTVAIWSGENYAENFQYKLAGTPCENVTVRELRYYSQDVQKRFPDDLLLVEMNAESYIGMPLHDSSDNLLGILAVLDDKPIQNISLVKSIIPIFANRAAVELERKHTEEKTQKLLQQNRELTQRMFKIQEDERRYLARELHDEFGQQLAAIHLNAETIKMLSKIQHLKTYECAQVIDEIATDVHKNMRNMLRQLRPTLLDEMGLKDSLKELVNQWQVRFPMIDIEFSIEGELNDFEDNLNISIYRIIQESLTNVAKHAKAQNVSVQLIRQQEELEVQDYLLLIVKDNGKGLDDALVAEGTGLPSLRERVLALGGEFAIKSIKGKGVHIEAKLPINVAS